MPRLIIFAVCEKVVIDERSVPSLIGLLRKVAATFNDSVSAVPKDALLPKEWAAYSLWEPESEDTSTSFSQVFQVLWPDGSEYKKQGLPFKFAGPAKSHQNTLNIIGFPVGQVGNIVVNTWLEVGSNRIGEIHSWTIGVIHGEPPPK